MLVELFSFSGLTVTISESSNPSNSGFNIHFSSFLGFTSLGLLVFTLEVSCIPISLPGTLICIQSCLSGMSSSNETLVDGDGDFSKGRAGLHGGEGHGKRGRGLHQSGQRLQYRPGALVCEAELRRGG